MKGLAQFTVAVIVALILVGVPAAFSWSIGVLSGRPGPLTMKTWWAGWTLLWILIAIGAATSVRSAK